MKGTLCKTHSQGAKTIHNLIHHSLIAPYLFLPHNYVIEKFPHNNGLLKKDLCFLSWLLNTSFVVNSFTLHCWVASLLSF